MAKTLYLECTSGISGDMAVAALLDLGADQDKLREVLTGIHDDSFSVKISRVKKGGIDCCDFDVQLDAEHENHDHDMDYLYGTPHHHDEHDHDHHHHDHEHDDHHHHHDDHDHHHDHEHDHHHHHDEHDHDHHHHDEHDHHHHDHEHGHHHAHRGMREISAILDSLQMTEGAKALSKKIFRIVAEAEAKAHAVPVEEVHFHEVGAIDSIVDIVSAAVCFDDLGIDEVIIPSVSEGSGTVRCQHGVLPVPVPAVAAIAQSQGLPIRFTGRKGELVTPTGAAIAAAVMTSDRLPEAFRILKTGYGAGKRQYEIPSILRAMLIEEKTAESHPSASLFREEERGEDTIWKLECEIDDSTGEQLGFALEKLLAAGARDAHYSPVFMKKNRPAWELTVLSDDEHLEQLENIIFTQTTTIGLRKMRILREILPRRMQEVETPYGMITVKICRIGDKERAYPEYDSVAEAAHREDAAFEDVFNAAKTAAAEIL